MKYCCEKFNFFYSGEKSTGLNIRIVKLSKQFIDRAEMNSDRSYFITEGYSGTIEECKKKMAINYCPFCGNELRKKYKSDDFVQETMDS